MRSIKNKIDKEYLKNSGVNDYARENYDNNRRVMTQPDTLASSRSHKSKFTSASKLT